MSDFITWLLTSSADPNAVGLTVRGFLVLIAPIAAHLLGLDADTANGLVDTIVQLVVAAMTLVGVLMSLFGLARKVYLQRWAHPNAV